MHPCDIHGEDSHSFRLYPGQDSPVFYFHLTPRRPGEIGVIVRVYQEEDWLGSARVHTLAREQIVGSVQLAITSYDLQPSAEAISLDRQRKEARENLRLIQERKSQYVLETNIPLELIKEERQLLERIEELGRQIGELEQSGSDGPV
jgi:hypothetical protein